MSSKMHNDKTYSNLRVINSIHIPTGTSLPTSGVSPSLFALFNGTEYVLYFFNGVDWVEAGSGTGNTVDLQEVLFNGNDAGGQDITNLNGLNFVNGSHSVTLFASNAGGSGDWSWYLPADAGTVGQVLFTDGAGMTYWGGTGSGATASLEQILINGDTANGQTIRQLAGVGLVNGAVNITMGAPSTGSGYRFTLPIGSGVSGQFLTALGSGDTTWSSGSNATPSLFQVLTQGNSAEGLEIRRVLDLGLRTASGSSNVTIYPPSSGNYGLTLPPNMGFDGQYLTTTGEGPTSWTYSTLFKVLYISSDASFYPIQRLSELGMSNLSGGSNVTIYPPASGSYGLTLPTGSGTNGQFLMSLGGGNTTWSSTSTSGTLSELVSIVDSITTTSLTLQQNPTNGFIQTVRLLDKKRPNLIVTSDRGTTIVTPEILLKRFYYDAQTDASNPVYKILDNDIDSFYTTTQQGTLLVGTGASGAARQGYSIAVSADGNTMVSGGYNDAGGIGATWVYTRTGSTWSQQGSKLVGSGVGGGASQQGRAVALSADGNTLAIGGITDSFSVGAVWIFTRSGGVWTQQGSKLVGTGAVGQSFQGISVALSADGNTLAVGGANDDTNAGAVWIFTRSGGVWTQQGSKLVGTGGSADAQQGRSVALSANGNTLAFGGFADASSIGAMWVFTRSGGVWTQQGSKIVGTGVIGGISAQGYSCSLSADGNTLAVGGPSNDTNVGSIWIFTRTGSSWTQYDRVGGSLAGATQQGTSVSLSADGHTLYAGAPQASIGIGAVQTFILLNSVWVNINTLTANDNTPLFSQQGDSVSTSADGNTVAFGGSIDNSNVGANWVFI